MYKIKTLAQRGSAFVAAVSLLSGLVTSALPTLVSANALNPLTERTLTLSSSSPGFHYKDGSGNTTFAPPGSGNNGRNTGETFSFKVSTDSSTSPVVHAFTFQYCTTPAGDCTPPGNGDFDEPTGKSNLDIVMPSMVQGTDFQVYVGGDQSTGTVEATDWDVTASRKVDANAPGSAHTEDNMITMTSATGITPAAGDQIVVKFNASATNYITNPGEGAFFVKINDYDTDDNTGSDLDPTVLNNTHIIDGGVTVANVMNDSIQIQTKVLETMSFSVGTINPDKNSAPGNDHGSCDSILPGTALYLGNDHAEYSLEVNKAYDTYSYWRLSSNSSGGATVYYSGTTLRNTVNDKIQAIGTTAKLSHPGTEQFGLALDNTPDTLAADMVQNIADDAAANPAPQFPRLAPHLTPMVAKQLLNGDPTEYSKGSGGINTTDPGGISAYFAFDENSNTSPVPIANEGDTVVTCATGKMRYVANIAATTPAGVYTSRINYIAAPEY